MGITAEEKRKLIENFVKENQEGFSRVKDIDEVFGACTGDTLRTWIKTIYGKTPTEFFTEQGVLLGPEEYWSKIFEELKARYSKKEPADSIQKLHLENPDLDMEESFFWYYGYMDLVKVKILKHPFPDIEDRKKILELLGKDYANKHYLTLKRIKDALKNYWTWREYGESFIDEVFSWIQPLLGISIEEFFLNNKMLLNEKTASKEFRKIIERCRNKYKKNKVDGKGDLYFGEKYYTEDIYSFIIEHSGEKFINEKEENEYLNDYFIDLGLLEGTRSDKKHNYPEVLNFDKDIKEDKIKESKKVNVYNNIDSIDVSKMAGLAGLKEDGTGTSKPKTQYDVNVNGKDLHIVMDIRRNIRRISECYSGYDALLEVPDMISADEAYDNFFLQDPNAHSDGYMYVRPEFVKEYKLEESTLNHRLVFIKALAGMLFTEEIAKAIAEFAPKKKNGLFMKNRITRIASSMIGNYDTCILEITGRAKADDTLIVTLEWASAKPESLDISEEDFLCTHFDMFGFEI